MVEGNIISEGCVRDGSGKELMVMVVLMIQVGGGDDTGRSGA